MARGDERSTDPFADSDEPVEVARVHHDDAFLDAIAGDGRVSTESNEEYQLALLFAQWRADVDHEPLPAGPTLDEVLAAIEEQEAPQRPRESTVLRFLRPVGRVAAAFLIVGGAATVVFSYNAQPGDALWSVKSVVFSSEANATMAKVDTSTALDAAASSLQVHDVAGAANNLTEAQARIEAVGNEGDKNELEQRLVALRAELDVLIQEQVDQQQPAPEPSATPDAPVTAAPTNPPAAALTPGPVTTADSPFPPGWPTLPSPELPTIPAPEDLAWPTIPSIPPLLPDAPPPEIFNEPTAPPPADGPALPTLAPPPVTTTPAPEN